MEHYFYLAVRLAVAGYILYKVWVLLFRDRLFGLWDRIPVRKPRNEREAKPSAPARKGAAQVVGRARGTYLANPAPALEPIPLVPVGPETDDTDEGQDEDFEIGPDMDRPSDEELYGAGNEQPRVTDYSTGWTFEQLTDAVAYAANPVEDDEDRKVRAAETFMLLRGTDLFDVIQRDVGNEGGVDRVIAECFDANGERLPRRKLPFSAERLAAFDSGNYI